MRILKLFTFILIVISLAACVPSGGGGSRNSSTTSTDSQGGDSVATPAPPTFSNSDDIFWFLNSRVDGTLTINADIQTVGYIRGSRIHNFLNVNSNSTKQYCIVASFFGNSSGAFETMRMRAIPQNVPNFSTGTFERMLRVEFSAKTDNSTLCDGSIQPLSHITGGPVTALGAFTPIDLCPNCTRKITSTSVNLYATGGSISTLSLVDTSLLDMTSLALRVDAASNSQQGQTGCTNSSCVAQGLDCCLDGQCVTDGQIRSNPDANDLPQALNDVANNPSNFVNWPTVYFVCGGNVTPDPTPTTPPDAEATASAELEKLKGYFLCLEEGKKETPDFATAGVCSPGNDQASFEAIRKEVWVMCGCKATPFPDRPDEPFCPDFGLKVTRNASNEITTVTCDIPEPDLDPTPVVILNYNLPSRSAPHRFYDTNGISYDDLSKVQTFNPRPVVEGEEFSYLDEGSKSGPVTTKFSMNAVLGQMSVALDRALPASMITVDFDKVYYIRINPSFYTPCPQCSNDAWFSSFKPYPTTSNGNGLEWSSYTTQRDNYDNNTTNGNYEDTIFGRACWLPPTMVPYSHKKDTSLNDQRRNRLATQAALWVNGYQRDWFGFNQGAIIGSFDGVSWFAIGKNGRRVVATSKKLYLAINAPHADLASNTNISLSVIEDNGSTNLPEWDYNPDLKPDDNTQNSAASCQHFHQCKVDSDCVSKLGWEYVCAETNEMRSYWPKFDQDAVEYTNDEKDGVTLSSLLNGYVSGGTTKRCVYRGAGSLCKVSYNSDLTSSDQKELLRCAPNFYCAGIDSKDFTQEIQRSPENITSVIYGQGAPVLGRPINYLGGSNDGELTQTIKDNLKYNGAIFFGKNVTAAGTLDLGLCRPGKRITQDDWDKQHSRSDSNGRADYISQIASCDSTAAGNNRVRSCPAFDSDGNYIVDTLSIATRHQQNMCGAESQRDIGGGSFQSTFKLIEGERLSSLNSLLSPSVVADACLRRPGAICHTDIDCAPNKLHRDEAILFDRTAFGGTAAEKKYWEENLVCGQASPKPFATADDFFDYDITLNRCCREIGKTITMYTASNDEDIVTDSTGDNSGLSVTTLPQNDPTATGRYSRYAISGVANNTINLDNSITAVAQAPIVNQGATPAAFQWKAINDSGAGTCCGGGWVRKFADGSNDWTNKTRVRVGVENFSCLNYNSLLTDTSNNDPYINSSARTAGEAGSFLQFQNWLLDFDHLCLRPFNKGCIQRAIPKAKSFEVTFPTTFNPSGDFTMDTSPDKDPANNPLSQVDNLSVDAPYMPVPFTGNPEPNSSEGDFSFIDERILNNGVSFYLPAYIAAGVTDPTETITVVQFNYFNDKGQSVGEATATYDPVCAVTTSAKSDLANNTWCVRLEDLGNSNSPIVFHGKADSGHNGGDWEYAGVKITFSPMNRPETGFSGASTEFAALNAGNDLYYLTKLGRLELSGIPQIFYEPLYCNDDRRNLVGGIFKSETRAQFEAGSNGEFAWDDTVNQINLPELYDIEDGTGNAAATDDANLAEMIGGKEILALPQVFSESEFQCCLKVGDETEDAGRCCTNFAATNEEGTKVCKLPSGSNLNVYYNRFVSSDGTGTHQPGGGLIDDDFNPLTGEPKLRQSTYDKIQAMGLEHCASGETRRGALFGNFFGQPNTGAFINEEGATIDGQRIYSMADSISDVDPANETGATTFLDGLRWDHHIYCK